MSISTKAHLPYIDSLRGYAVLMVITCHLAYVFPELPYPVRHVVSAGWFGVQLFFLASSITLMTSWARERSLYGTVSLRGFFTRRILRIAPAYYLAACLYGLIQPGLADQDGWTILTSLLFLNGLTPDWARASNAVVPGGWSIGAEFAFYAVFPIVAAYVTSFRRAVALFTGAVAAGYAANQFALMLAGSSQTSVLRLPGLFFWFPNQCSVFALGIMAYFLVRDGAGATLVPRGHATFIALGAAAIFTALIYAPLGSYLGVSQGVPASLAVSVVFVFAAVALASGPSILANPLIAGLGRISFSAYLLHFAVLDLLRAIPGITHTDATGYAAIAAFVVAWPVTVGVTSVLASLSYRFVEQPFIGLGKLLVPVRPRLGMTA